MAKKKNRVRATNAANLSGREMIMTEAGYEPVEKATGRAQSAVHAPQVMTLSNQSLPPRRGTRDLLRLYSESPWLRAIVGKIGRAVAETDWMLYAKFGVGGKASMAPELFSRANGNVREKNLVTAIEQGKVKAIETHPLLDMLAAGTGNPRLNGFAAIQVTQQHLDLTGEAFWLLENDNLGTPIAFWPLPPSWVTNLPSTEDPYYTISTQNGAQVKIPMTMMVPFVDPDPDNPYGRGSGLARSLDDELQIEEYAAKHAKSFFLNRARPDIIISGQFVSPKDAERLEKQWMADHQGFWKSFKPLFFSQKIDVKELSQTFESLQMVQLRKHERDTFISVFGAPPEKFGVIGESKRSTIAAADYFWNKDLIKPRVEMIMRILQQVLVPKFDERLILYYDTPVIQDEEFKLNAMHRAPWAATINEWRKVQGHPTLGPAGDVLVIPMNQLLVPTKQLGEASSAEQVVQESIKQRLAHGGNAPAPDFDARSLIDEIVTEVSDALDQGLRSLKTKEGEV